MIVLCDFMKEVILWHLCRLCIYDLKGEYFLIVHRSNCSKIQE